VEEVATVRPASTRTAPRTRAVVVEGTRA
jgi:hypothetical protein